MERDEMLKSAKEELEVSKEDLGHRASDVELLQKQLDGADEEGRESEREDLPKEVGRLKEANGGDGKIAPGGRSSRRSGRRRDSSRARLRRRRRGCPRRSPPLGGIRREGGEALASERCESRRIECRRCRRG
mmetsp:Transcript_20097/g.43088  ORF Transcript_20097/g.43088 Transcript_20097/m.43088 type:complete len:132 (+) Transcript_20097:482-877(+)